MLSRVAVAVIVATVAVGCGEVPVEEASNEPSGDASAPEESPSEPSDESQSQDPSSDPDVETFEITDRSHVTGTYDYPQTPPAGGPHNQVWQNCGYYDQPVVDEHAVHSLEHGAVWITYDPGLPDDQVDLLRDVAASDSHVLVSPYDGLPSAVVASAWGAQVKLADANDPALGSFLDEYVQGAQTPEPGAPCDGGTGTPN